MKTLVTTLAIVAFGATALAVASPYEYGNHHGKYAEKRIERMTQHLDLTDQQQEQVRTLIENQVKDRQNMHQQMQEKIRAVLTDEQIKTFDEMHAKREKQRMAKYSGEYCDREKGKGHHHHGHHDD